MYNLYDILYKKPVTNIFLLSKKRRELAYALLKSGKVRIDAESRRNFLICNYPKLGQSLVLSNRELFDKNLLPETFSRIKQILLLGARSNNERKKIDSPVSTVIQQEINKFRAKIGKYIPVGEKLEKKIVCLITQATEPEVLELFLYEKGEVFISYSHNIGDLLEIRSWQEQQYNNGMQSILGHNMIAVYSSCGGNPFLTSGKYKEPNDGKNALSRMLVILGQEFGHYADIVRNKQGRFIKRYSANLSVTSPSREVYFARRNDIKNIKVVFRIMKKLGLIELVKKEQHIEFYSKNNKISFKYVFNSLQYFIMKTYFINACDNAGLYFIRDWYEEKKIANKMHSMILDMNFNVSPKADAYERDNSNAQEAIWCVEGLARVPQQVIKWGHKTTRYLLPEMYKIYYLQVIKGCEDYLYQTERYRVGY